MANIAINNYCNLKCPYCFADDMIQEDNKNLSIDNYIKILNYLIKNNEYNIGIIGGEPTLHPNFKDILIESNNYGTVNDINFILFTNGIELEQYLPYIGDKIRILINCNNIFNINQKENLYSTITHCFNLGWLNNDKVQLGCNLYIQEDQYEWIWSLVDTFNIHFLRCSVVSPGGKYQNWRNKKDEYFKQMKPIFLEFCKKAKKRNVKLGLDCGYIPSCYFSNEELEFIESIISNYSYNIEIGCQPIMDITPDLNVVPCFGLYNYSIPLDFNKSWFGLFRYFTYKYNFPKTLNNIQGPCANCEKLCDFQCQGGCLAFSSPS